MPIVLCVYLYQFIHYLFVSILYIIYLYIYINLYIICFCISIRPDGYILYAYVSFFASKEHNDGNILYYIIKKTDLMMNLNVQNHLALVDRGFWPLIEKLTDDERSNLFDHISPCLANVKPIPTIDVNLSRLCTSNRWIIEAVFGVVKKQWRILSDQIHARHKGWINSMILSLLSTHNYL